MKLKAIMLSRTVVTNAPTSDSDGDDDETGNEINWLSDEEKYTLYKKIIEETSTIDYDEFCDNTTATAFFREDPFICNKYIRCNHGYAQRFKCAKSTAWDVKTKQCLWAQHVKCGKRQLITNEKLLGKNDSDESMKRNGTRPLFRNRFTKPIATTKIIKPKTTAPLVDGKKRMTTKKSKLFFLKDFYYLQYYVIISSSSFFLIDKKRRHGQHSRTIGYDKFFINLTKKKEGYSGVIDNISLQICYKVSSLYLFIYFWLKKNHLNNKYINILLS